MDPIPVGGFVRLRSRARGRYLHADEDATSVSLRALGAAFSPNAVCWKAVEGGDDVLFLQNVASGKYVAAAGEDDERPPPGHRGVLAVQRDFDSPEKDASFAWRVLRVVEAGENMNYVRLHNNDYGCLRANGKHRRSWSNLVTINFRNGDETTMMQWGVEAILQIPDPEYLLLSPPPPQAPIHGSHGLFRKLPLPPLPPVPCKEGSCCVCGRKSSADLCRRCGERIKDKLLAAAETRIAEEYGQKHYYCLECKEIFTGSHKDHQEMSIPIGHFNKRCVAWATGEEKWIPIFGAIEIPDRGIRPYQLFTSKGQRCDVCRDVVSEDLLYGVLSPFCSLHCFVTAGGGEETVEKAIVEMDPCTSPIGFCLTCATAVIPGEVHSGHDWLRVRTDSAGLRRVVLPGGHQKIQAWERIKKEGGSSKEVLIRDDSSVRCEGCEKRLASEGDSCSLQCKLDAAGRKPRRFLPRSLPLQQQHTKNL